MYLYRLAHRLRYPQALGLHLLLLRLTILAVLGQQVYFALRFVPFVLLVYQLVLYDALLGQSMQQIEC